MTWRDERQPASFRGLPFEAEELARGGGSRLVVDEYPETDDWSVENLGRAAERFRLRGFVAGDDYLDQLGNLEAAFNQPAAGELVHPWRGRLMVHVETYSIVHTLAGACGEFEIECVVAGLETRPLVVTVTETDVIDKGEIAITSARDAYLASDEYYLARATGYLNASVEAFFVAERRDFEEILGVTLDATGTDLENLDEMASVAGALDDVARLTAYLTRDRATRQPYSTGTPRETAARDVCDSSVGYLRTVCLARVCQLATAATYTSADAADDAQQQVDGLLEAELLAEPPDDLFGALSDLRASFVEAIASTADQLPRLREIRVIRPIPSLVLACDLYGSVDREAEVIALNNVGSPFFVGGGVVRVLS